MKEFYVPLTAAPLVSVIIVTWNSEQYLVSCLECLKQQSYQRYELIVVDNGSKDQSIMLVQQLHPTAKIIVNNTNVGFATANNQGIHVSRGDYVLCLNTDVFLDKEFIKELIGSIHKFPGVGAVCGKLLRAEPADGKVIDSTGLSLTPSLRSRDRGIGEIDHGQYDQPFYVFAACAAAALYKRTVLDEVKIGKNEYFDETFFSYYEDTDLGWRIRSAGWECVYNPKAVGRHVRGGAVAQQYSFFSKGNYFKVHTIKNRYLMIIKNLSLLNAILLLPFILPFEIIIWGYCLTHPRLAFHLIKALLDCLPRAIYLRTIGNKKSIFSSIKILNLLLWPPILLRIRQKFLL